MSNENFGELYFKYREDPCKWVEKFLGFELWSKQREIVESVFFNRRTVVPSGHGVGKTACGAATVLSFLFLYPNSKVITTAPTWIQVKKLLWAEVGGMWQRFQQHSPPGECSFTQLRITDKWFAIGVSPNQTTSMQGYHAPHILCILDEAPGVRLEIVDGMETLMTSEHSHMLMIGNPTGERNHFYNASIDPKWNKVAVSCYDSPNFTGEKVSDAAKKSLVTPSWVEEKRLEWGDDSNYFRAKIQGEFPEESTDQLIGLKLAEGACQKPQSNESSDFVIGVDVARFGDDFSVFAVLDQTNNQIVEMKAVRGKDTMEVAGMTKLLREFYSARLVAVDDCGVGGGVTDRLRELSVQTLPVNGGERAIEKTKFFNRRSELWWCIREWLQDGGTIATEQFRKQIIADLVTPLFTMTSNGRIKLESKDEIRKRLGRSTDYADAIAIALAGQHKRSPIRTVSLNRNSFEATRGDWLNAF